MIPSVPSSLDTHALVLIQMVKRLSHMGTEKEYMQIDNKVEYLDTKCV